MDHPNKIYMERAIKEARVAIQGGQYPLGAIVILNGKILSTAHTTLHETNDPSAHAEMNAIRMAAKKMGSRYLKDAWLYTTQEPCPMCVSVAIWAKMAGIVYGASKADALKIFNKRKREIFTWRQIDISAEEIIAKGEPKLKLCKGFLRDECIKLYNLK